MYTYIKTYIIYIYACGLKGKQLHVQWDAIGKVTSPYICA